jgi:hypothetical protein
VLKENRFKLSLSLCPNFLFTAGFCDEKALNPEATKGTASIDFIKFRRELFIFVGLNFYQNRGKK